jgi:hypothetical protein
MLNWRHLIFASIILDTYPRGLMETMYQLVYRNISTETALFQPKNTYDSRRMLHKIWRKSSHNTWRSVSFKYDVYLRNDSRWASTKTSGTTVLWSVINCNWLPTNCTGQHTQKPWNTTFSFPHSNMTEPQGTK